jgi:uncharacterized protein DUF1569
LALRSLANQRDLEDILRRLRTVRPDSARRWGRMTAHQMICHIGDACRMATGEHPVSPASGLAQRTVIKWIALYLPLKWPPEIQTRPEIDQVASGGTIPGDFAADLARAETLARDLVERAAAGTDTWPAHPIFGRLSRAAWMRWAYLHLDHHLRQFGA